MTPQEEAKFERDAQKMLSGHRLPPNGRNVFAFTMRNLNNVGYREKFDNTFRTAPGSRHRLDKEYCPKCDRRRVWCECADD